MAQSHSMAKMFRFMGLALQHIRLILILQLRQLLVRLIQSWQLLKRPQMLQLQRPMLTASWQRKQMSQTYITKVKSITRSQARFLPYTNLLVLLLTQSFRNRPRVFLATYTMLPTHLLPMYASSRARIRNILRAPM